MGSKISRSFALVSVFGLTVALPKRFLRAILFLMVLRWVNESSVFNGIGSWTEIFAGEFGLFIARAASQLHKMRRPKRIILIRHGESVGNVNKNLYATVPDNRMELSKEGKSQAVRCAQKLKEIVGDESVIYYVSPYLRTRMTQQILAEWVGGTNPPCIVEPRIREQDFGNFQNPRRMKQSMKERADFGRFYYRFTNGESGADVYDRMSSFFNTLFRHVDTANRARYDNYIIVSHGLTMRLFVMRYLKWSVHQFEQVHNPENCEIWVMSRRPGSGRYELQTDIRYGNYEVGRGVPSAMRVVSRGSVDWSHPRHRRQMHSYREEAQKRVPKHSGEDHDNHEEENGDSVPSSIEEEKTSPRP
ncbi:hypothetical protein AAMO2058_000985300 [Amorphochlora amoebiformis]